LFWINLKFFFFAFLCFVFFVFYCFVNDNLPFLWIVCYCEERLIKRWKYPNSCKTTEANEPSREDVVSSYNKDCGETFSSSRCLYDFFLCEKTEGNCFYCRRISRQGQETTRQQHLWSDSLSFVVETHQKFAVEKRWEDEYNEQQ